MKTINVVLVLALIILLLSALIPFFNWRDKQIQIGADTYEKCVLKATGRTPAYWYVETGAYPECNK